MPAVCPHFLHRKSACRAAIFVPICRCACAAEASLKTALHRKKGAALFAAAFLYPKKKAALNAARQNFLPFATAHFPCIRMCCGKKNCFSAGRWPAAVRCRPFLRACCSGFCSAITKVLPLFPFRRARERSKRRAGIK